MANTGHGRPINQVGAFYTVPAPPPAPSDDLSTTLVRAPFYVPSPEDPAVWYNTPISTPITLTLPTSNPFIPLVWRYGLSFDDTWAIASESLNSTLMVILSAGGQPHTKQWHYDNDDASGWTGAPESLNSAPIQMLSVGGQIKNKQWLFGYDDPSVWCATPETQNSALIPILTVGGKPKTKQWHYDNDDTSGWIGASEPVNSAPIQMLSVGGQIKNKQWLFGYDDPSVWRAASVGLSVISLPKPQSFFPLAGAWFVVDIPADEPWQRTLQRNIPTSLVPVQFYAPLYVPNPPDVQGWYSKPVSKPITLISTPLLNPFLAPQWMFGYDDPSVWQFQPLNISGTLSLVLYAIPGTIITAYDEPAIWDRTISRNQPISTPAATAKPFINPWANYNDDPSVWNSQPIASKLITPLLTAGGKVRNNQWLFGFDDLSTWNAKSFSNQLVVNLSIGGQIKNKQWLFGYDDPAIWVGQPIAVFRPTTLIVTFFGAVYPDSIAPRPSILHAYPAVAFQFTPTPPVIVTYFNWGSYPDFAYGPKFPSQYTSNLFASWLPSLKVTIFQSIYPDFVYPKSGLMTAAQYVTDFKLRIVPPVVPKMGGNGFSEPIRLPVSLHVSMHPAHFAVERWISLDVKKRPLYSQGNISITSPNLWKGRS